MSTSPAEPNQPEVSWPILLDRLARGDTLSADEAAAALGSILAGGVGAAHIAAFAMALRLRGETVEEMAGMVRAMLAHVEPLSLGLDVVDTCGTGGDGRSTINVSTIAALVVAGAGVPVCKHGGRAASSATGSADVLAELGVVVDLGPQGVAACVREAGIGFCFAPRFHPAMAHVAPVRRELGMATVFNFLGPLANPAHARRQVVGVSNPAMAEKMVEVLAANGAERTMVVWGDDGIDELSTTCISNVIDFDRAAGTTKKYKVDPVALGFELAEMADLVGGGPPANAAIARTVLAGQRGPKRDIVVLNAAAGLVVAGRCDDLETGVALASSSIDSGSAAAALEALVEVSVREQGLV